jgi:3-oxoacyl-(acyl-carrier-protein) synthase
MWDATADGYTRGEGFSAIFLKTLSQAIADGDQIESIVRETGVNSDGKTPGMCREQQIMRDSTLNSTQVSLCLVPVRKHV